MMTENKNQLVVSESFYSIQGEGQTMGVPAFFLRLAGCNLLCKSASWICDSIEVWKKGIPTKFEDIIPFNIVQRLEQGSHLVITGGEPMLHQKMILQYLSWFEDKYKFLPIIEIETNGTINPEFRMIMKVKYWNCSPKLENSGEPFNKRVNLNALRVISEQPYSMFKFVIQKRDDIIGILAEFDLPMNKVWLMPAGSSQKELKETRKMVAELAIQMNVRYSDRLHVGIWDQATGV